MKRERTTRTNGKRTALVLCPLLLSLMTACTVMEDGGYNADADDGRLTSAWHIDHIDLQSKAVIYDENSDTLSVLRVEESYYSLRDEAADNIYFYGPKSAGEKPYGTISNPYEHFGTFIPLPPSFSWEVMEDGRYTVFSATPPYQHYICTMRYIEPRPQLGLSKKEKALGNKNYAYDESYMEVTLEKEGSGSLAVLGTYYPYFYERYTQEHPERDLDNTFFQLWGTIVYYLYRL